ncbi:MAG: helix-turn-helix domain-containing protein [Chloroflexi bacterium]|nr:helix-turn-helix domain-containing protein [Chloroflexota bacterium]
MPTASRAALTALTALTEEQRQQALDRFGLLRPTLDEGVPRATMARARGVPLGTARRWLQRYRQQGFGGLARVSRVDRGRRCLPDVQGGLSEGRALRRPAPSVARVHRQAMTVAEDLSRITAINPKMTPRGQASRP